MPSTILPYDVAPKSHCIWFEIGLEVQGMKLDTTSTTATTVEPTSTRRCAEATTPGMGDATTAGRIGAPRPNHPVRELSARPYDGHRSRPGSEPRLPSPSTRGSQSRNCGSRTTGWPASWVGRTMTTSSSASFPCSSPTPPEPGWSTLPPAQISNWDDLVKAFAGNFQGTYVRPGNSWDLRSCRQQPRESLLDYIRRYSKQRTELPNITDSDVIGAFLAGTTCRDLVSKLGRKTPTRASERWTSPPSSPLVRRRSRPSSGRTSSLRGAGRKTSPRRPLSTARGRRARRSRKRNATPPTQTLSPPPSTGTLGSLPEAPTCLTRSSRSRAPIIRVPSSTPLRNASCFGANSIRPGHRRKVAEPTTTTRRRITRQRSSPRSTTAS
jgi:hypothetical protein